MSVNVTIDIGQPEPAIPTYANVHLEYADQQRDIRWEYTGRAQTVGRGAVMAKFQRFTSDPATGEMSTADVEIRWQWDVDERTAAAQGRGNAGPLQRAVATHLSNILCTAFAVDAAHDLVAS